MENYLKVNYHTHTYRCNHAFDTERDYIERAIQAGIKKLGFSDHVPCPFKDGYVSRIRMEMYEAEEYVSTIRKLKEEYKDRIELFVGFETEYIPEFYEEQMKMFQKLNCDYMIMGQHFLTNEKDGPYVGSVFYDEAFLKAYVNQVIEGMKTGSFLYLAHPDLVNFAGDLAIYQKEIFRLCKTLKELQIPLEFNLLGILAGKRYPRADFWKIAGEVQNDVIFGIDAHEAKQIGNRAIYQKGMEFVEKYQLHLIEDICI